MILEQSVSKLLRSNETTTLNQARWQMLHTSLHQTLLHRPATRFYDLLVLLTHSCTVIVVRDSWLEMMVRRASRPKYIEFSIAYNITHSEEELRG
jgi:hypothetical protein